MTINTRYNANVQDTFHVAVVGGAIMDLVFKIERMPDDDESLDAQSLQIKPGGKGSNSAIAIYRAQHERPSADGAVPKPIEDLINDSTDPTVRRNVEVYLNTAVGRDAFGSDLTKSLKRNHINTQMIREHGAPAMTGTCAVFVEPSQKGRTRDIGYPGANTDWIPRKKNSVEILANGKVPDLVVCHLETKRETIEEILRIAVEHGVDTLLNPSPVQYMISDTYKYVTHLIVNRGEAAELSGMDVEDLVTPEAWEEAAQNFLVKGVKNVVITVGKQGAYYSTDEGQSGFVDAIEVTPVDETGAG